jgi:hypothetical protein
VRRVTPLLLLLIPLAAGCLVSRTEPPSPHCRSGPALAGVYHPQRLKVKSRCRIAVGTVEAIKFEDYDGDVHIELRLDRGQEALLSRGNDQVGGTLIVEIIPWDRTRVRMPEVGDRVEVVGPWVDDTAHGWNEIHPAWWISAGTIQPATEIELRKVDRLLRGLDASNAEDD